MDLRGQWLVHVYFAYADLSLLQAEIASWNSSDKVDEPLQVVRVADLLSAPNCITNLPGLIGFIKDYDSTKRPLEIRY
jgi:hypothetical protein